MSRKSKKETGKARNPAVLNPTLPPAQPVPPSSPSRGERVRTATRVNIRFLAITLLVAGGVAVGTKLLHNYQVRANAVQLLQRADQEEKSGKRDEAVKLLNQYVSLKFGGRNDFSPEEEQQRVELLIRLGRLADPGDDPNQRAKLFKAFRTFEEVLRRDNSRRDIRRRTVEIAMIFARYRDALEHLSVLQQDVNSTGSERVQLLKLQGQCHLAVEEIVESQLSYLEALKRDHTDVDLYVTLAAIWSRYPEKAIDASTAKFLEDSQLDFIREALPGGSRGPVHCALELLDVMCQNVQPVALAKSRQARFLLDLRPADETLPKLPKDATDSAAALFRTLNKNDDGKLTGDERLDKEVPLLADRNGDRQIERGELIEYFRQGSYRIRFETAASAAFGAWESLNANPSLGTVLDRADVLDCLTEANVKLADTTQFQSIGTEQVRQYRQRAREFAALGQKLPLTDVRFFVTTAELELSEFAATDGKQARLERLRACEGLIREGLARSATTTTSDAGPRSREERQRELVQKAAVLKLQWMLVDVLYTLAANQDGQAFADALDVAKKETKNLEKLSPAPSLLEILNARGLMVARDYAAARDQIEQLRNKSEQRSELWRRATHLLAECDARLENPDAVLDIFGVAAQADPATPAVFQWQLGQAAALAAIGKVDEAIQAYIRILNRVQMPAARTQLIELELARLSQLPAPRRNWALLQTGHEQNQVLILPLPETADEPLVLPQESRLAVLMADYAYLRALTGRQLFETTQNPVHQAEAIRYLQLAEQILSGARDRFPDEPLIPAAQIVSAARRFDQGVAERISGSQQFLKRAISEDGDSLELRLAAIQAAAGFPVEAASEMLKDAARESSRFGTDDQSRLLQAVAKGFAAVGDLPVAIEYWEQAARVQPREIKPRLAILELLLIQAEREKSIKEIEAQPWNKYFKELNDLEGSAGKGPYSCVFAARKLVLEAVRQGDGVPTPEKLKDKLTPADELLKIAAKLRPYWPTVPRTLGAIAATSGNTELALQYFQDAIKLGDRSEPVVGAVLEDYRRQSRSRNPAERADAQEKITRLLDLVRTENASLMSGNVGRIADQILWSRSQVADAIGINEKLSQPTAEDKIRLAQYELAEVNFAEIREFQSQSTLSAAASRQKQQVEKAETLLKEAISMSPEHPKAWMSLTQFYAQVGDVAQGEQTIESAGQKLPENPPQLRPFTLAWCYEALSASAGMSPEKGQSLRELAKKNYQAALEANPDEPSLQYLVAAFFARDGNPQQSLRLLNRVLSSNRSISEPARAQAMIAKAGTLASTGRREDLDQGIDLLQTTKFPGNGWQARGLRLLCRLLMQRHAGGDNRLILKAMKDLGEFDQLTIDEGLELARLADSLGDWTSARNQYDKLHNRQPDNGAVLASYIHALIRRTEDPSALKEARTLYVELEQKQQKFFRTKAMKCRLVAAEGKRDEAVNELSAFVKDNLVDGPKAGILDEVDGSQLNDVLQNLTAVARSSGDLAALDLLSRADQLARSGAREEAARELKKIGKAQKMVAELRIEALRETAELAEELGAPDRAIDLFKEYAARSSRPGAVLNLARCLGRHGRGAEGIELCEKNWPRLKVTEAAATELALLRSVHRTGLEVQRVADRLASESQAATDADAKVAVLLLLADARDLQASYDDAQAAFEQVLQVAPNHIVAKNNLAFLLANRQAAKRALELIDDAIGAAGRSPELLDTKGVVLMNSGQPEAAVRILTEALNGGGDSALLRLHFAEAYRLNGNAIQSRVHLEKAEEMGLKPAQLHPFDRAIHERLSAELRVAENR